MHSSSNGESTIACHTSLQHLITRVAPKSLFYLFFIPRSCAIASDRALDEVKVSSSISKAEDHVAQNGVPTILTSTYDQIHTLAISVYLLSVQSLILCIPFSHSHNRTGMSS